MQIGTIGPGRMGANMVRRLLNGGHQCVVFDMSAKAVSQLTDLKAEYARYLGTKWRRPESITARMVGKPDGEAVNGMTEFLEHWFSIQQGENIRVGIATDHGGFDLKEELVKTLQVAGHEVVDFGADQLIESEDYPDYVLPLAQAVAAQEVERGVAICGSGVGASVCANKVRGVRAALIHDHFSARQGVEDDHMNIVCMGGRTVGPAVAWDLVQTFLAAEFSDATRHLRRLGKVASLEPGRE